VIVDLNYVLLFPITNTRDRCLTKYDHYMVIGDVNYDLMSPITKTRDKCLTKYENYMVIGDLNYDLLCPITNTLIVILSQTLVTSIGDWTQ
jgi:hypothetical protein